MTFNELAISKLMRHRHIDSNGCWLWTKSTNNQGYGGIALRGKVYMVHRLAYEVFVRAPKYCVLHQNICQSRACFNPTHLYEGTQTENIQDSFSWGYKRGDKGESDFFRELEKERLLSEEE